MGGCGRRAAGSVPVYLAAAGTETQKPTKMQTARGETLAALPGMGPTLLSGPKLQHVITVA